MYVHLKKMIFVPLQTQVLNKMCFLSFCWRANHSLQNVPLCVALRITLYCLLMHGMCVYCCYVDRVNDQEKINVTSSHAQLFFKRLHLSLWSKGSGSRCSRFILSSRLWYELLVWAARDFSSRYQIPGIWDFIVAGMWFDMMQLNKLYLQL